MIDKLYHDSGFVDMGAVLAAPYPFIIMIGARGVGKTYGTLCDAALDHPQRFIYFRTKRATLDLIMEPALQPFKRINTDRLTDIRPTYGHGLGRFFSGDNLIGYAAALSTFSNTRGFDGSDITLMILDEFIPEPGETLRFNSYLALLHAYETINRNREFEGQPPLKLLLLSNSDDIYNDIVSGFKIGDDLLYMQETGEEQREINEQLLLIRPAAGTFRKMKEETALYQIAGRQFTDVALSNSFLIEDRANVRERPLKEYIPVCVISGICLYKHKNSGRWYAAARVSGTPKVYGAGETERRRFLRENAAVWRAYQKRRIDYDSINTQTLFKLIYT